MSYKAEWAYDFSCKQTLEEIQQAFNAAGPWQWQLRDNYMFGNYLNTRPVEGGHFRIHAFPQAFMQGERDKGFSALLRIDSESKAGKEEIDLVFRTLLEKIEAEALSEVEPYD